MEEFFNIIYELLSKIFKNKNLISKDEDMTIRSLDETQFTNEIVSQIWTSTPKIKESQLNIITKLRTEVNQIRTMLIEHINDCHEKRLNINICNDKSIQTNISEMLNYIPLPPPPPLPPTLLSSEPPHIFIREKKKPIENANNNLLNPIQLSMKEILKDVANVKLKPIPRTPGGQPSRIPVPSTNNSLTKILTKRFKAFNETLDD